MPSRILQLDEDLWLRMDTGQTQYSSPFLSEVKSAAADDVDDTRIAHWGEVTEPGNDVVRPEVVEITATARQTCASS